MKQIFLNDNSLKKEDIDFSVTRVKAFVVNEDKEVLIAYNNYTYQFLGGHREEGESLDKCLERELKEETGISMDIVDMPFLEIITYDNNYMGTSQKVENKIYYYQVFCSDKPNFNETKYDAIESLSDFKLVYVKLEVLKDFIILGIEDNSVDKVIGREMLLAIDEYNNLFGGKK